MKGVTVKVIHDEDDLSPHKPEGASKLVYSMRNPVLKKVKDLWPQLVDSEHAEAEVLTGEHYVHNSWFPLRSSLVIGYDEERRMYETLNSYYRVVDA